jgi:cytochrome c
LQLKFSECEQRKGVNVQRIVLGIAAGALLVAAPVRADEALAKKHNCTACHAVDKKLIGPAYQEVAKKYKGQKDAAEKMAAIVKKGSTGVWGPVPMPPNAAVPDDDIKKLVAWVLAQAK